MDKKILWFDTETTGLDENIHGIIQLGYVIEINKEVVEEKNFLIKPPKGTKVDKEALAINKMSLEKIRTFPEGREVYNQIQESWGKHCDKFTKEDKFYPAGYNVDFDLRFMVEFFKQNDDKYFGSWCNWKRIDPLPLLYLLEYKGVLKLENYKLTTVCDYFNIPLTAHDALSDIKATRELFKVLIAYIKE